MLMRLCICLEIHINRFMARDDSPYANVISKCMLWVRGLVPLSEFWDIQFSCSVVSDCLRPHGLQHTRPPCPSPTPGVYSNSSALSWWCHATISSCVVPFSSCLQSFPASGSFQWVSSSHQVAKVLAFQHQYQSFQWIFRTDFLQDWLARSPFSPRNSQESSPTPKFRSIYSLVLSFLYSSAPTSIHDYWKNHSFDWTDLWWQSNVSAF